MDFRVGAPKIRMVVPPEESLRTLTQGADQAEAWAARCRSAAEPWLSKLYAVRRRIATAAVAILTVWLFVHVMFGANGMAVYRGKRAEYQNLQTEIEGLQKENERYSEQVNQLKSDPKRIEREAREQFHYARPGEVVYVAPDPAPPQTPMTHSARK